MYEEIFDLNPEQQRRVRARYFELIQRDFPQRGRVEVIDASRAPDAVSSDLLALVDTFLDGAA